MKPTSAGGLSSSNICSSQDPPFGKAWCSFGVSKRALPRRHHHGRRSAIMRLQINFKMNLQHRTTVLWEPASRSLFLPYWFFPRRVLPSGIVLAVARNRSGMEVPVSVNTLPVSAVSPLDLLRNMLLTTRPHRPHPHPLA